MADITKQEERYYGKAFSNHRPPKRNRVSCNTDREDKARRRLAALEEW